MSATRNSCAIRALSAGLNNVTLIRVCDSRVLVIIRKTPHKMSCYNQLPENDQKVACKNAYHIKYYAKHKERILTQQKRYRAENVEILKTRRKRWYEINKKRLASSQKITMSLQKIQRSTCIFISIKVRDSVD